MENVSKVEIPIDVKSVLRGLRMHFAGRNISVILYGSSTRGTADKKSDFDINIVLNFKENIENDLMKFNQEYAVFFDEVVLFLKQKYANISFRPKNPCFEIGGNRVTVVPKISSTNNRKRLLFPIQGKTIENNPSLVIRLTSEKNIATNGEYKKTILFLKNLIRKVGFNEGGYVMENLLIVVPVSFYQIQPMNLRLYKIMHYLKKELNTKVFSDWKKMDRNEQLFANIAKFKQIKRYVTYLTIYFSLFK